MCTKICIQILGGVHVSTVLVIRTVVIMIADVMAAIFFHYHLKHVANVATQCVYVYTIVMQLLNFPAYSRSI